MGPEHYTELDQSAVLFEPPAVWLTVEGPDRVTWLQGMVSNDVGRLESGQGCQAAHLTAQGKIVALMTVLVDDERLCILTDALKDDNLASRLDSLLIMEDAMIEDRSQDVRVFSLVGAGASQALCDTLDPALRLASLYDHATAGGVQVSRSRIGYDLVVPSASVDVFLTKLDQAGVSRGGEDLRALVCIEAGVPRWGVDVDSQVTLPELGEEAIDYEKGCYVGQEVVAKIKYIGRVNRRLMGLKLEGARVPGPGGIERNGRDVGRLTSAGHSPSVGGVIALAYMRRGSDSVGTEVEVIRDGESRKAIVIELPFVERRS